jgi:hypothetical protein
VGRDVNADTDVLLKAEILSWSRTQENKAFVRRRGPYHGLKNGLWLARDKGLNDGTAVFFPPEQGARRGSGT